MKGRYWLGADNECNLCQAQLTDFLIDGATRMGPWAVMCPTCHGKFGRGLGTGLGQRYGKTAEGRWLKVAG